MVFVGLKKERQLAAHNQKFNVIRGKLLSKFTYSRNTYRTTRFTHYPAAWATSAIGWRRIFCCFFLDVWPLLSTWSQNSKGTNVSTNVPQTFQYLIRMRQKTLEFVPEFLLSKDIISIRSRRAGSGPTRNNLFSIRKNRERYQNVLV